MEEKIKDKKIKRKEHLDIHVTKANMNKSTLMSKKMLLRSMYKNTHRAPCVHKQINNLNISPKKRERKEKNIYQTSIHKKLIIALKQSVVRKHKRNARTETYIS